MTTEEFKNELIKYLTAGPIILLNKDEIAIVIATVNEFFARHSRQAAIVAKVTWPVYFLNEIAIAEGTTPVNEANPQRIKYLLKLGFDIVIHG